MITTSSSASSLTIFLLLWSCYNSIISNRSIVYAFLINHQNGSNHKSILQKRFMRPGHPPLSSSSSSSSLLLSTSKSNPITLDDTINTSDSNNNNPKTKTATRALFISSFTDGVQNSPHATKSFFHYALASSIVSKVTKEKEDAVKDSVLASPCNGPNVDLLEDLEKVDEIHSSSSSDGKENVDYESLANDIWNKLSSSSFFDTAIPIRVLYIPTAMYALRADSNNTPGKQRQRARADGKKRRNVIVREVQKLFGPEAQVLTVTLDLDDGSVKQPAGSDDASLFPKDGKEALQSWSPHLVYVEGGNTFWLQHCITKGEWSDDIIAACTGSDAAVYCGKSAGAIAAGALVETATWKGWDDPSIIPGMETYQDWNTVKGLCLAGENISFFPHMSEEWDVVSKEKIEDLRKDNGDKAVVCCLEEDDAFCVDQRRKEKMLMSKNMSNCKQME